MQWKIPAVAAVALLLVVLSLGCLGQDGDGGDGTGTGNLVNIQNFEYRPATLNVMAGTNVTWVNLDSTVHDVTSTDGNFTSSGDLNEGDAYQVTFDEPGEYPYYCTYHPEMTGIIVVTA